MNNNLRKLTEEATHFLHEHALKVCTAESCTGGYLGQMLTSLPGSSAWFDCGFITYSNEAKQHVLSVPQEIILAHGAVSEAVAIAMAKGALALSRADLSVAITGIAGPSGATPEKPVGTVWFAWQWHEQETLTRCMHFSGEREWVRIQAVCYALERIKALPRSPFID